jgi:hypothetical protein
MSCDERIATSLRFSREATGRGRRFLRLGNRGAARRAYHAAHRLMRQAIGGAASCRPSCEVLRDLATTAADFESFEEQVER